MNTQVPRPVLLTVCTRHPPSISKGTVCKYTCYTVLFAGLGKILPYDTPTQAYAALAERHAITTTIGSVRTHLLFGLQSLRVQEVLHEREQQHTRAPPRKRTQPGRLSLRETASRLKDQTRLRDQKKQAEHAMFGYKSVQAVVGNMIRVLEDSLIQLREPEYRACKIVQQLIKHPHIKPVLQEVNLQELGLDPTDQMTLKGFLERFQQAVGIYRNLRDTTSLNTYQVLLNVAAPPSWLWSDSSHDSTARPQK